MTLDDIVLEVISLSGRPDKEDYIRGQVRSSIMQIHKTASYPRDRVEATIVIATPTNNMKLALPARFRKFEIVAGALDDGTIIPLTTKDNFYERRDPTDIVNNSYTAVQDMYYLAGTVVNIKSSVYPPNIYMMYFANPDISLTTLETWAMADSGELFVTLALSKVLGFMGNKERAKELHSQYVVDLELFVNDNLVEGY